MDGNFGGFYTINSSLPAPAFYILLNIFYWIFWINLMVGLTNTLPTLPLDAGYMTRDGIEIVLQHTKMKKERREKVVKALMLLIGLLILFMILFQIIGPRIFGA
jgi:membrane-associated protease RseP (regulator of RpoE activity)